MAGKCSGRILPQMRICYTSDLHGAAELYEQLEELLRVETPDLLILGGDLFPDGTSEDPLGTHVAYIEQVFMPRVAAWRRQYPQLSVACCGGNHEWLCGWEALEAQHNAGRIVLLHHARVWAYGGLNFLGYSSTPPTPHWVKDFERLDLPGDAVPGFAGVIWDPAQRVARDADMAAHFSPERAIEADLATAVRVAAPWILVAHCPPYDTKLDRLPKVPGPIGSRAVRRFIEQRQPAVALHGHVHESPAFTGSFTDRVGRTLCINPGQGHERLHAVVFDAERPAESVRHTIF